jgi:uncharacterized protein (UPF0262 family)
MAEQPRPAESADTDIAASQEFRTTENDIVVFDTVEENLFRILAVGQELVFERVQVISTSDDRRAIRIQGDPSATVLSVGIRWEVRFGVAGYMQIHSFTLTFKGQGNTSYPKLTIRQSRRGVNRDGGNVLRPPIG